MIVCNYIRNNLSIKAKLLVLLMMLMLIDYAGFGYYIFYLPLSYWLLHKEFYKIDKPFLLLLLFGIFYGGINLINNGSISYIDVILYIVNCPLLYMLGKFIAKYNEDDSLILILFLFVLSLAFISLISVLADISQNGFYVLGGGRNLPMIGLGKSDDNMAATGISSRLIPLSFFFSYFLFSYNRLRKFLFIIISSIAIFCTLRIQSRTAVLGLVLLLIIISFTTWKTRTKYQKVFLLTGLFSILIFAIFIYNNYADELAILDRFEDDDVESGGGRIERLINVAINIPKYPLGMGDKFTFAHNLWFDCARVAGIIPFLLLILITLSFFKTLYLLNTIRAVNYMLLITFNLVCFSIFIVFMVEPVLEGISMLFELYCIIFGMMRQTIINHSIQINYDEFKD